MKTSIHTVLGATGATGKAVIEELRKQDLDNSSIRAVARNTENINQDIKFDNSNPNEHIEIVQADLLDSSQTKEAIKDSSYVYLCVGLPYRSDVWEKEWIKIMQNVVSACEENNSKLIFFDNIYMYGNKVDKNNSKNSGQKFLQNPITETHPQFPSSRKGKARKETANFLLKAINNGKIQALIARSADFYGEEATNSTFYISFLENMLKNKAPQSVAKPNIKHTYSFVEDNAKALVLLALNEDTYNQVWHLPVGKPITIEEITAIFNQKLGTNYATSFLPNFMRKILSLFVTPLKEVGEMLYQFEEEYVLSFEKFATRFPNFNVTSYEKGIEKMIASFQELEKKGTMKKKNL